VGDRGANAISETAEAGGERRRLVVGADLGKVTSSLAWGWVNADGVVSAVRTACERHRGSPLASLERLYVDLRAQVGPEGIGGMVATGHFSVRLGRPVVTGVPEEIAEERAAAHLYPQGALNVVRVGGSGFSILVRDEEGGVLFENNDRCSAGTGETIERLCERLGSSLDEAAQLAADCPQPLPLTARCSVFAKSELTHYANQGAPHDSIFSGYFESVGRSIYALVAKYGVDAPLVVVGNGAFIAPVMETLKRLSGAEVVVPEEAGVFEALGALFLAAEHARAVKNPPMWPECFADMVRDQGHRIRSLTPAARGAGSVVEISAESSPADLSTIEAVVLGLDLGSTGSKAAVIDAADGAVLLDAYRRTDGNPVEAAKALVAELVERGLPPVAAIGVTGSGRDAVGTVLRAAYPEAGERLLVQNEIVAHATAAVRLDPNGGRSLSIVEIGGQDAKFINVEDGRVLESDMNRVCSAGTGSFLEEQAVLYGVDDIAEFGRIAERGERPPDLGQMCTVFIADLAVEALGEGFTREDIFAGFQYSVISNYKKRVMGNRRFLDRVFFQGKPASNHSLARTLAAVTGREVCVPPNPGAMGAIGIALLAAEAAETVIATGAGEAALLATAPKPRSREPGSRSHWGGPFDLVRFLDAAMVGRREFVCGDRSCHNMCRIESVAVQVGDRVEKVRAGGSCPKYESESASGRKLPKGAPHPYREREELLESLLAASSVAVPDDPGAPAGPRPVVGLPYVHYLIGYLPFFHRFFSELGVSVRVLRSDFDTLAKGDRLCTTAGACAPVKIAHGLAEADVDILFLPKFIDTPPDSPGSGTTTCPLAQATPEMIDTALTQEGGGPRVSRPVLKLGAKGLCDPRLRRRLAEAVLALDPLVPARSVRRVHRAFAEALHAQRLFEAGLEAIGEKALAYAREEALPVIVVVGESHIIHEPLMSSGIHELVTANGAIALPADCYPVPEHTPTFSRVHWASAVRSLRASVAGAATGGVFPLMIGAYGCGLNSFVEHLFNDVMENYPHTVLESDGHVGKAGYVTRVQAFLHAVRSYEAAGRQPEATAACDTAVCGGGASSRSGYRGLPAHERILRYETPLPRQVSQLRGKQVIFGSIGGTLGGAAAAALRGRGIDARFAGEADPKAWEMAHEACSGKECLPYQLIWGCFARSLEGLSLDTAGDVENDEAASNGRETVMLGVGQGFRACRAHVFPLAEEVALERMGLSGRVQVADLSLLTNDLGMAGVMWSAVVFVDLLNMLRFYHLSFEREPGSADRLFSEYSRLLEKVLERPMEGNDYTDVFPRVRRVGRVLEKAARAFAELPRDAEKEAGLRDVFLCGDVFLRVNEWGNDDLQRRLSALGLRVIFEPFGELFELLALRDVQEQPPGSRLWTKRRLTLAIMDRITHDLVGRVRVYHPWVVWNDIRAVDRESRRLLDGHPFGESIPTIGGSLYMWKMRPIDGVVVVSPRGCGPALISEAQLRRQAEIPILFVYNDGDPIDDARLAGFAWRLRRRPPRADGGATEPLEAFSPGRVV